MKPTIQLLREFSLPLICGVIGAVVWANVSASSYHAVFHTVIAGPVDLHFLTNDLFMVLFFGIAAVEVTASFSLGGSLYPLRTAVNPLMATAGGVAVPVAVYFLANRLFGAPELARGWGIAAATDIALAWLVARLIFGKDHPAVAFLLLLAVVDDAIGLAIIALFYPDPLHPVRLVPLMLVGAGIVAAGLLRRRGVHSYWPYLLLGGSAAWMGLFLAHLHPALALVFVVPFMPHRRLRRNQTIFDLQENDASTLACFEHDWKKVVDFGLFLFGLANAGVEFSRVGTITWLVLVALIVGKTVGIFGFAMLAHYAGFPLPPGISRKELFVVGMVGGIGLTVALFVAGEAFTDPVHQGAAKMGALFSGGAGLLAMLLGKGLRIKPASINADPRKARKHQLPQTMNAPIETPDPAGILDNA